MTVTREPYWRTREDYRSPLDRRSWGVLFDGQPATHREDARQKRCAKARAKPYQAACDAGMAGEPFDPADYPEARDLELLEESWEAGVRWARFMRNGARQDAALARVQRVGGGFRRWWRHTRTPRRRLARRMLRPRSRRRRRR